MYWPRQRVTEVKMAALKKHHRHHKVRVSKNDDSVYDIEANVARFAESPNVRSAKIRLHSHADFRGEEERLLVKMGVSQV
jgi:hypothetical protein